MKRREFLTLLVGVIEGGATTPWPQRKRLALRLSPTPPRGPLVIATHVR
jgi:hypothetical protein